MDGELDVAAFVVGELLHLPLAAVDALPNAEITAWLAYLNIKAAMAEAEAKKARSR